jgi:hypothetical protein
VIPVTSTGRPATYIRSNDHAGFPGQPLERAMTTVSYHFESPIHALMNTSTASVHAAKDAMQALSREEMEERRWQLEWERRNIED